jgi:hypothetical protein
VFSEVMCALRQHKAQGPALVKARQERGNKKGPMNHYFSRHLLYACHAISWRVLQSSACLFRDCLTSV